MEHIINKCLEKERELRYQTAAEIRGDLRRLQRDGSSHHDTGVGVEMRGPGIRQRRLKEAKSRRPAPTDAGMGLLAAAVVALLLAFTLVGCFIIGGSVSAGVSPDHVSPRKYSGGALWPGRPNTLYSAAWQGNPSDVYTARPEAPESRSMGLPRTQLLSVSSNGEMAVLLNAHSIATWVITGTLARAPLIGGAPREILDNVQWADWTPDGKELAIVRDVNGRNRLEYPAGKVLYESGGWIGNPRISPNGDRIAFIDHPIEGDDGGSVAVVDLNANKKVLSRDWYTVQGLAWSPDGTEVWFTSSKSGIDRTLSAVTL